MLLFLGTIAFLFGLCVGSFLNVVVLRSIRGEKLSGRSHCDSCGKTLGVRELLPVVSFLIQKERCRNCGIALSWQYPFVELGTGISYATAFIMLTKEISLGWGFLFFLFLSFAAIAASLVILVADIRFRLIPNGATVTLGSIGAGMTAMRFFSTGSYAGAIQDLAGAIFFTGLLGALWFFSRGRWMGFGDVKLILATSLLVGSPHSLVAFLFSFWLGALAGVILLLLGRKNLKDQIPFGPSILVGTLLALLFTGPVLSFTGFARFF